MDNGQLLGLLAAALATLITAVTRRREKQRAADFRNGLASEIIQRSAEVTGAPDVVSMIVQLETRTRAQHDQNATDIRQLRQEFLALTQRVDEDRRTFNIHIESIGRSIANIDQTLRDMKNRLPAEPTAG